MNKECRKVGLIYGWPGLDHEEAPVEGAEMSWTTQYSMPVQQFREYAPTPATR